MHTKSRKSRFRSPHRTAWLCSGLLAAIALGALFTSVPQSAPAMDPDARKFMLAQKQSEKPMRLTLPVIDPTRGKALFIAKGCVLCHSVNGVGGRAGPPLDRAVPSDDIDILDFSARMWRGAFAMIELQGMELGYQLDFTGEELGHIIGFLSSDSTMATFDEDDVPDLIKDMFIREPYDLEKGLKTEQR